jgi:ATP-dependent Clp protease ATP-binding subunit ClpC
MNNATMTELKAVVDRVVQPVRATMARKRRMREELLAHLVAIYDEEGQRGDERAAMERAKRRLGDPRELAAQLQHAVPWWDRSWSILEDMGCRPGESAWRLAARHFLATLLISSVYVPLWLLAHGNLQDMGPVEAQRLGALILAGAVLLIALFNVILSTVLAAMFVRFGPFWAGTRRGRVLLAVLCGLASLCGLALAQFTAAALLFVLMARQTVKQWHYQGAWA